MDKPRVSDGDELNEFIEDDGDNDIRFDQREEGHIYESIEDEIGYDEEELEQDSIENFDDFTPDDDPLFD